MILDSSLYSNNLKTMLLKHSQTFALYDLIPVNNCVISPNQ